MRIAVDLTPVLPNGANGGAKIVAFQLVKHLAELAPHYQFLLLGTTQNIAELEQLKAPNIQIMNTTGQTTPQKRNLLKRILNKLLPVQITLRLNYSLKKIKQWMKRKPKNKLADLLFCPFTGVNFKERGTPVITIVHDLQFKTYPYFFSIEDRFERRKNFEDTYQSSDKIICVSDYVNHTVILHSGLKPNLVKTIHTRLAHRLPDIDPTLANDLLKRLKLSNEGYLLFPANFWVHKNHQMLLTAFSIYRQKYQGHLKLVCTGADNPHKTFLLATVKKMGLADVISMPGFLTDQEFAALLKHCKAVIFPSLYEGFGMPVLEAMAAGKPVLCSNVTSLPEVACNAALLFDPRKPDEIADAIHRIETENDLVKKLIERGKERIATFGTEKDMANDYLAEINHVLNEKRTSA